MIERWGITEEYFIRSHAILSFLGYLKGFLLVKLVATFAVVFISFTH